MTETPSQSVRCPVHGTYYRPDRERACPRCMETAAVASAAPRAMARTSFWRISPVTALIWLIVLSGGGWGGYRFLLKMGDRGGELHEARVEVASRIDPSLVRAQIQALENLVYAAEIEPYSQGSRIQRASLVLYQGVMQRASKLLAARHGNRIVGFGSMAVTSEDVGYGTIDMDRIRREWEAVRVAAFHDAAWFRTARR